MPESAIPLYSNDDVLKVLTNLRNSYADQAIKHLDIVNGVKPDEFGYYYSVNMSPKLKNLYQRLADQYTEITMVLDQLVRHMDYDKSVLDVPEEMMVMRMHDQHERRSKGFLALSNDIRRPPAGRGLEWLLRLLGRA